jgi:hypothetical protein
LKEQQNATSCLKQTIRITRDIRIFAYIPKLFALLSTELFDWQSPFAKFASIQSQIALPSQEKNLKNFF